MGFENFFLTHNWSKKIREYGGPDLKYLPDVFATATKTVGCRRPFSIDYEYVSCEAWTKEKEAASFCDVGILETVTPLSGGHTTINVYHPWGVPLIGRRASGGKNHDLYWGTVDGFQLLRMKKKWLKDEYQQYYDKGDGEWFVTVCLCAGVELEYAIALRSAIIHYMGLAHLDGSEKIDEAFQEKFRTKWDWNQIRQLTLEIAEGKAPLPDIQLGSWAQQKNLPNGLKKYYKNDYCNYRYLIPLEKQIQQGLNFIAEKKPKEAIEHFDKLLEINPDHAGILYSQTKALILSSESEKIPQQIELLTELKKKLDSKHLDSNDPYKNSLITLDDEIKTKIQFLNRQQIQEGSSLLYENKFKEAIQYFHELLKTRTNDSEVLFYYAKALIAFSETENTPKTAKNKFLTEAKETLQKITKLDNLDTEAFIKLNEVETKLQYLESPDMAPSIFPSSEKIPSPEQKEAVLHFRKLLESEPNNIDALFSHAKALFDFSESAPRQQQLILLEQAKEELKKILEIDELNTEAYSLQEKIDERLEQLNTAVSLNTPLTSASVSLISSASATPTSPQPSTPATSSYNLSWESLTFNNQIGSGGFGVVYKGTYQKATVAIKQLHLTARMSHRDIQQFESEIKLMSSLRFPHIVTFYGACFEEGHYAIVMEYCPTSLYYRLHSNNPPNNAESLKYSREIALALSYLHNLEPPLIYRDLKSMNVLIDANNTIKLTDFGLAELIQTTKTSESSAGTIPWMAPETFGLKPRYSTKSDIFSLAILLWEIASREIPYKDAEISEIKAAVKEGEREDIPDYCSSDVAALIVNCWKQNPQERPSANEVYQNLTTITQFFKSPPHAGEDSRTPTTSYIGNTTRSMFSN